MKKLIISMTAVLLLMGCAQKGFAPLRRVLFIRAWPF